MDKLCLQDFLFYPGARILFYSNNVSSMNNKKIHSNYETAQNIPFKCQKFHRFISEVP